MFCRPKTGHRVTLLLLLAAIGCALPLRAQAPAGGYGSRPLPAQRLPDGVQPPVIDGDISDPAWQRAARADTFIDAQTSKPASDQTTAYLMYDKTAIYVAFHCFDSKPAEIVARETVRDAQLDNDDYVLIRLDPFMTFKGEDSSVFEVNPIGTQNTRLSGGRAGKVEWQGQWMAAARRVPDGWTAEMRIPWAILSYPSASTPITMAFQLSRSQARTHVFSFYSDLSPAFFNERLGRWIGVQPPRTAWKPRLSLLPYLLPGAQMQSLDTGIDHSHVINHYGLDVRYQPTPQLTGVAAIKPDFSNIEGAVEGIGFSRGERYVPERRPFFLDGGQYLQLGQGYQIGQLFDSVHIHQFDAGAKTYGQVASHTTLGALGTYFAGDGILSKEGNFVAQLRHDLGPTSGLDVMTIHHESIDEQNSMLAVAPDIRRGKWGIDSQLISTSDTTPGADVQFGQGHGLGWTGALNFQDTNFFSTFRGLNVGDRFSDRLGLIFPIDYKGFSSFTDWGSQWRRGKWRSFDLSGGPTWDWHQSGAPFRRQFFVGGQVETRDDHRIGININGGKFDNQMDMVFGLDLGANVSNRFHQYELSLATGKQADKAYSSIGPSFRIRTLGKLDLVLGSFLQNYQGFGQQHVLTFNYELSASRSWGGRIVLQDADTNWYLAYRNAGHAGTETYLILGDPNSRRFTKQILLKMVFAI